MKRAAIFAALLAVVSSSSYAATRAQYLMGTVCEIDADVPADPAFAETARIESMVSTWRDDSELARVNRGAEPGPELRALLDTADAYAKKTGGAFDPHIMSLLVKWRVRVAQTLVSAPAASADKSERADRSVCATQRGYEEGGFAKGYAIDRMLDVLRANGATRATINFGGQLGTLKPIDVTIADPKHRDRPVVALTLDHRSLSTSSTSEKPNHIIDPRIGKPSPAWGSVSVISDSALEADILSTALYVMGPEKGLQWARAHRVIAIFIDNDSIQASAAIPGIALLDAHFTLRDMN